MKTLVVIGLSLVFVQALGQELLAQDLKVLVSPHFGASAVNNSGHLGGIYTEGVDTGAIYRNGNLHILSNPTGFNFRSVGFSDSGVLPGYLTVPGGDFAGAYYDRDGVFHHMPLLNGGTFALPQAVASDGTIVGWADSDVGLQMFSLRHGAISGIGVLSDEVILEATSTNRHGQVVGTVYRRSGHGEYMGSFYYDAVGGF
ncbi:MAG TPA: hypothetical protein PKA27_17040, partial [Fimbriimonadaceae bacterium]|nr:hypothetical protein [Fimbriimonadaceae bacterium]